MAFSAGDTIIKQGDLGDCFYIVKAGEVIVTQSGGGFEKELARCQVVCRNFILSGPPRKIWNFDPLKVLVQPCSTEKGLDSGNKASSKLPATVCRQTVLESLVHKQLREFCD